jgi:hypothetical protein
VPSLRTGLYNRQQRIDVDVEREQASSSFSAQAAPGMTRTDTVSISARDRADSPPGAEAAASHTRPKASDDVTGGGWRMRQHLQPRHVPLPANHPSLRNLCDRHLVTKIQNSHHRPPVDRTCSSASIGKPLDVPRGLDEEEEPEQARPDVLTV